MAFNAFGCPLRAANAISFNVCGESLKILIKSFNVISPSFPAMAFNACGCPLDAAAAILTNVWGDFSKILVKNNYKVTILCESPHYPFSDYYKGYNNSWSRIEKSNKNLTIIRSKAYASNRKTFYKKILHYTILQLDQFLILEKLKTLIY